MLIELEEVGLGVKILSLGLEMFGFGVFIGLVLCIFFAGRKGS